MVPSSRAYLRTGGHDADLHKGTDQCLAFGSIDIDNDQPGSPANYADVPRCHIVEPQSYLLRVVACLVRPVTPVRVLARTVAVCAKPACTCAFVCNPVKGNHGPPAICIADSPFTDALHSRLLVVLNDLVPSCQSDDPGIRLILIHRSEADRGRVNCDLLLACAS